MGTNPAVGHQLVLLGLYQDPFFTLIRKIDARSTLQIFGIRDLLHLVSPGFLFPGEKILNCLSFACILPCHAKGKQHMKYTKFWEISQKYFLRQQLTQEYLSKIGWPPIITG
jgi:hypothetical protein